MSIIELFLWISGNLIWVMLVGLVLALILRYVAFKASQENHQYYTTFSSNVEKQLEVEDGNDKIANVELWFTEFLHRITDHLPDRSLRLNDSGSLHEVPESDSSIRIRRKESIDDFVGGKKVLLINLKQHVDAFKSPHPPNFSELTTRVLKRDKRWRSILRVLPVDTLTRVLHILPGLFIVGGIFGTFLGITGALPLVAKIDLNKINEAVPILNQFVGQVAFSMHTSIAGIICSVVLTILNALFPITAPRQVVCKRLERAFESIWYRIHGEKVSEGEAKIINLLDRIHRTLVDAGHRTPERKAS